MNKTLVLGAIFVGLGMIIASASIITFEIVKSKTSCEAINGTYDFHWKNPTCNNKLWYKYLDGWDYERNFSEMLINPLKID